MLRNHSGPHPASASLVLVLLLAGCAPGHETPTSSPLTPSIAPSSDPRAEHPKPAFPASCLDIERSLDIAGVAGTALRLTRGTDAAPHVRSFFEAQELEGGLLTCIWGDVTGTSPGVSLSILPRTTTDAFDSSYGPQQPATCRDGIDLVQWVTCGQEISVNGYWISTTVHADEGTLTSEISPRYDAFVSALTAFVSEVQPPKQLSAAPLSALHERLCVSGRQTLAAAYGVDVAKVFEPGHGGDYDIGVAAGERAGATNCVWGIEDRASWEFFLLPRGEWAFDERIQPLLLDRGLAPGTVLAATTIAGADQARTACAAGRCEAQLTIDGDLLIVISSEDEGSMPSVLRSILRLT